jgi:ligand-binding sensor domain-containing protein
VVPAAIALSDDGRRLAVGGIDGALYIAVDMFAHRVSLPEPPGGVREPIERLAFAGDTLKVGTSSSAFEVSAALQVKPLSPPVVEADPALRGLLVNARARYGSAEVIATDAGAFMRASPGAALTKIVLEGLPCGDRISALTVQGDVLWIGSFDRGLCRLDANGYTHFAGPKYLPSDMVNALASDEHTVYVATDAGLATIDAAGTFAQFTHQQCVGNLAGRCPWHAAVNGVAVDSSTGMVWVADIGALHRIDPLTGEWQHPGTRAVLGSQAVTRVAAFNGEVAIGTSDRGVLLWNGKRTRVVDDQHGLADNWVTDVAYDTRGRLWVGTCTRGVSVRERDGRIRNISSGLSDDYVLSVQELDGRIWLGTLSGATLLDGQRPIPLDTRHGLGGNEVHDAVFYRGHVWLATDGGLSAMDVVRLPSEDE